MGNPPCFAESPGLRPLRVTNNGNERLARTGPDQIIQLGPFIQLWPFVMDIRYDQLRFS